MEPLYCTTRFRLGLRRSGSRHMVARVVVSRQNKNVTSTNTDSSIKVGILTSGGDAQGMNAAVRAAVRTVLHQGGVPYAIYEGWRGAVAGGDFIRELKWNSVSKILSTGGTQIGTARSDKFRDLAGRKEAVYNLLVHGIDRLIVIGGDGSLTGANLLAHEWTDHAKQLIVEGRIDLELANAHPRLMIVGLVGSIDNDLVGVDMTIGADTALHRIIEALDAISSTAASHQRTFVIEVMGRRCGYLALMSAVAGGCDYVLIPERPPHDGWEQDMCDKLRAGRAAGRRDSLVVIAEGAQDEHGHKITADYVRQVLVDRLGEDVRVTSLGHVQRGGTPSAYDRWMSSTLGYSAAIDVMEADEDSQPRIIGSKDGQMIRLPLMKAVKATGAVKDYLDNGDFAAALKSRGKGYREMVDIFDTISSPTQTHHLSHFEAHEDRAPRVAVLHAGGLASGMNPAARATVRLGLDRGFTMLGVHNSFNGLIAGEIEELAWGDVDSWVGSGGAELGTKRDVIADSDFYALSRAIEKYEIDAIVMIGGFVGYESALNMRNARVHYPNFKIPVVCIPASIDNNLPAAQQSVGADTALNNIAIDLDRIRQSAEATNRCFVVETMGRSCGYIPMVSAIIGGAEQVYIPEVGITLDQIVEDTHKMQQSFEDGRRVYMVVRGQQASDVYSTDALTRIFNEEGHGVFDARPAVLGYMQQGGNPTPFDRTLAIRYAHAAIKELTHQFEKGKKHSVYIGNGKKGFEVYPLSHMDDQVNIELRRQWDPWWMPLSDVVYTVNDRRDTTAVSRSPLLNVEEEHKAED